MYTHNAYYRRSWGSDRLWRYLSQSVNLFITISSTVYRQEMYFSLSEWWGRQKGGNYKMTYMLQIHYTLKFRSYLGLNYFLNENTIQAFLEK